MMFLLVVSLVEKATTTVALHREAIAKIFMVDVLLSLTEFACEVQFCKWESNHLTPDLFENIKTPCCNAT